MEESRSVLVKTNTILDTADIESYFSTRARSGGGNVISVDISLPNSGYVVTFENLEGEFDRINSW